MEPLHPLKALLQLHLATDSRAATHLPYILGTLHADAFTPSSHLAKWTARVNSLLHSKETPGRWAGLCLANHSGRLSKPLLIDNGQSWVGLALPVLSKPEPVPNIKAAIRLVFTIFSATADVPEFQRQVATPNVPKFSQALIALVEKQEVKDIQLLALATLARLVPLYPNLHRALHSALSALCLRLLNGTALRPSCADTVRAASRLYAVLPHTGGKVGAANLWRKSFDETLAFAWGMLQAVTSTVPHEVPKVLPSHSMSVTAPEDPVVATPLNLDRLHCSIAILCELLQTPTSRPVQVPVAALVHFIAGLYTCTSDEKSASQFVDSTVRAIELSLIPELWKLGCTLLSCLARAIKRHLTPNAPRLISYISYHLEQPHPPSQRLPFLRAAAALLAHTHPTHNALPANRLTKAVLPSVTRILSKAPAERHNEAIGAAGSTGKKGRKRARGYEGDEVFAGAKEGASVSEEDGEVVLAALDVLDILLRNPNLSPPLHSLSTRVLLSALLALPHVPAAALSADVSLHTRVLGRVRGMCTALAAGGGGMMSRSLSLVVEGAHMHGVAADAATKHTLDLLLHPRRPPLLRPLPPVEALALFPAEEGQEERELRASLGLVSAAQPVPELPNGDGHTKEPAKEPAAMRVDAPAPPPEHALPVIPTPSLAPEPVPMPEVSNSKGKQRALSPPALSPPISSPAPAVEVEHIDAPIATIGTIEPKVSAPAPSLGYGTPAEGIAGPSTVSMDVDGDGYDDEGDAEEEMPGIDIGSDSE